MKAFVSAQMTPEGIEELRKYVDEIKFGGWGATGKKLTPQELVKEAADCEILVICYEDINDYVLDNINRIPDGLFHNDNRSFIHVAHPLSALQGFFPVAKRQRRQPAVEQERRPAARINQAVIFSPFTAPGRIRRPSRNSVPR